MSKPDEIPGRQIDGSINIPIGFVIRNARQGKIDHLKRQDIILKK